MATVYCSECHEHICHFFHIFTQLKNNKTVYEVFAEYISLTFKLVQDGEPALEWSPIEDDGRNAPAVFYTKKVGRRKRELNTLVACQGSKFTNSVGLAWQSSSSSIQYWINIG